MFEHFRYLRKLSAALQIECGQPKRPTLLAWLLNISMNPVAVYLHTFCNDTELFDASPLLVSQGGEIKIASWPQWANFTSTGDLRLEGYAYAVPTCASEHSRAAYVDFILGLTGHSTELDYTDLPYPVLERFEERLNHANLTLMPEDYLSYSVHGARIMYQSEAFETVLNGTTNQYGHFEAVGTVPLPINSQASLRLQGCKDHNMQTMRTAVISYTETGLTIVSDVDDVLRVAEIWNWHKMFSTLFLQAFRPWDNMPKVYESWSRAAPETHFHYYSDAPEMSHQYYVNGTLSYYPAGTFGFRPMQIDTLSHLTTPRYNNIKRLLESFPKRKFVLVGDTATGSVLSAYGTLAKKFPQQIQCILLRDVNATEPANWIVPNLKALPKEKFRLFARSADLLNQTEALMVQLAQGENVGCGNLTFPSTEVASHGGLKSWMLTIRGGVAAYARCFLRFEFRPSERCFFDGRGSSCASR